jgi:hypothetical protein
VPWYNVRARESGRNEREQLPSPDAFVERWSARCIHSRCRARW